MSAIALKQCPCCGGIPEMQDHRTIFGVQCTGCGLIMLGARAPEPESDLPNIYWRAFEWTAALRWNRRALEASE